MAHFRWRCGGVSGMGWLHLPVALAAFAAVCAAAGRPTLFINEDAWVFFCRMHDPRVTGRVERVQELERYIDGFAAGGKVTDIAFSVNGIRMAYPSLANDPMWRTIAPDGKIVRWGGAHTAYYKLGIDPFAIWIARCRENGIRPWISMRLNDVHFITSSNKVAVGSTAWRNHPEWRRVPDVEPAGSGRAWDDFAFNYSLPEVRDFQFGIFKEIVDRYDADGYELDALRWINHLAPGREREDAPLFTDFVLRCRAYSREIAKLRGHPVLLACRVPSDRRAAVSRGLDAEAWARADAVDIVIPCNFYSPTSFEPGVGEWIACIRAANPKTMVLAGAADSMMHFGDNFDQCRMDWETICGWADLSYREGATGLYLYNASYVDSVALRNLKELGLEPAAVGSAPRRYIKTYHDVSPAPGVRIERALPAALDRPRTITVRVATPPGEGETASLVIAVNMAGGPAPEVSLNGAAPAGPPEALAHEMPRRHGCPQACKAIWRYPFAREAVRQGTNVVSVGKAADAKTLLRWLEISVDRCEEREIQGVPPAVAAAPDAPPPDRIAEFVARNWKLVPHDRLARLIGVDRWMVDRMAQGMDLSPATVADNWRTRNAAAIIRANWDLLDYPQMMELLGVGRPAFEAIVRSRELQAETQGGKPRCGRLTMLSEYRDKAINRKKEKKRWCAKQSSAELTE